MCDVYLNFLAAEQSNLKGRKALDALFVKVGSREHYKTASRGLCVTLEPCAGACLHGSHNGSCKTQCVHRVHVPLLQVLRKIVVTADNEQRCGEFASVASVGWLVSCAVRNCRVRCCQAQHRPQHSTCLTSATMLVHGISRAAVYRPPRQPSA